MLTIGDDAKQLGVHLDSFILLGKLHFAEQNFEDALKYYDKANIDSLEERQLPPRSLKIMAEAFAIKVNLVMESLFFFDNRISCFSNSKILYFQSTFRAVVRFSNLVVQIYQIIVLKGSFDILRLYIFCYYNQFLYFCFSY